MKRRLIYIIIILLAVFVIKILIFKKDVTKHYNIVYLTSDSVNIKYMSTYGCKDITTPTVDSLAKNGVVFDNMINASGWTNESLVSIFTSLEPPIHGVETRSYNLDKKWLTPLEILRKHGYTIPRLQPWQADQNHSFLGFEELTVDKPEDWIRKNKDKKFFLWYQYLHCHLPYNPPDEIKNKFFSEDDYLSDESRKRVENSVLSRSVLAYKKFPFKKEDYNPIRNLYKGELYQTDMEIKKVIDTLKELDLIDNTIIIIGADHGEELFDHGWVGHASTSHNGTLYHEIIHVPFIIHFPKTLPKNKRISMTTTTLNIMPTILDMLGIDRPDYLRGRTLLKIITGKEPEKDEQVYCETTKYGYQVPDWRNIRKRIRAVFDGRYKLIYYLDGMSVENRELFDLHTDPGEHNNIFENDTEVVTRLSADLAKWFIECKEVTPPEIEEERDIFKTVKKTLLFWKSDEIDYSKVPSPPEMVFPKNNMVLKWSKENQGKVRVQWNGRPGVPYIVEYEVGTGDSNFKGNIKVKGFYKDFGPFTEEYWNTYLQSYNPWRFRISIDKPEKEWSDWIEFNFTKK